jgi:hypothetical protein
MKGLEPSTFCMANSVLLIVLLVYHCRRLMAPRSWCAVTRV